MATNFVYSGPGLDQTHAGHKVGMANTDDMKGRVKQAAGDLTGDAHLKREGIVDRIAGKAKEVVSDAADKAKDASEHFKEVVDKAKKD